MAEAAGTVIGGPVVAATEGDYTALAVGLTSYFLGGLAPARVRRTG